MATAFYDTTKIIVSNNKYANMLLRVVREWYNLLIFLAENESLNLQFYNNRDMILVRPIISAVIIIASYSSHLSG